MPEKQDESEYGNEARKFIEQEIKHHREKGMPQDQAVAAAMDEARRKGMKVPEEE